MSYEFLVVAGGARDGNKVVSEANTTVTKNS
jgi:hypothetical protein